MPQPEELYSAGNEANARGDFAKAADLFRDALATKPDWPEALHNLASVLYQLGQVDEALALFRRSAVGPQGVFSSGMAAVIAPGAPGIGNAEILQIRRNWDRIIAPEPIPRPALRSARESALRIGYFSSFFHRHNYMKPVWALINRHDRTQFEVHLFSDAARESIGAGYRPHKSDSFHYAGGLKITQCADLIKSAQLDLLIDLNAYSRWRRLPVYGLRPAPVIATWFNSYATTGMCSVDYIVGDATVAPPDEDRYFTEKVLRVNGSCLTFEVNYAVPPVVAPPSVETGRIAFGCLAPLYKITPGVIAAWCEILQAAPNSTLLLKNTAFASTSNREYVLRAFARHEIASDRLLLEGPAEHYRFLDTYSKIDIALDTFPYNGGTTTTEAIWQGVPVIAFHGDRWAARTSASILRAGNLGRFVDGGLHGYIELASRLASDRGTPALLAELRRNMRYQLTASPVCDAKNFSVQIEELWRQMHLGCPRTGG